MNSTSKPMTRRSERGLATLTVVAVLFFIMSLVAAYTNRNLIFEQRTSGNQYRATLAHEAAEAGVEWALAQLNGGRIDANCTPSSDVARTTFRQRYLTIDAASGVVIPAGLLTPDQGSTVWPTCVFNGASWDCGCPDSGTPVLAAPAGTSVFPAFRLRFVRSGTTQPAVVQLEVNGCTRMVDSCLNFPAQPEPGEGRVTTRVLIALRGALAAPPVAALTVRGDISIGGATMGVYNDDAAVNGVTVLAGGTVAATSPNLVVGSAPGSPAAHSIVESDPGLQSLADNRRFFSTVFATWPETYRDQPATVRADCAGACNAGQVRALAALNPGRVIWVDGDLNLDTGGALGSAVDPVLLVATGQITVDIPVYGLVYSHADDWASAGTAAGEIHGALVAGGRISGNGSFNTLYNAEILARLRWLSGSFVRVPGGWKDF